MDFYICSTPYHLFISLCNLYTTKEKGIFYLTTHDESSERIFINLEKRLIKIGLVQDVIVRKRNLAKERLNLEYIKDNLEYKKIKKVFKSSCVFNFAWNPYSLYTISNFLYNKASKVILVEDGSNLYKYQQPSKLKLFIKKYLYGVSTEFYKDRKLEKILVQYPEKYPEHLQSKIGRLDVNNLILNLSKEEKESIISIFLSENEVKDLLKVESKDIVIILTQPLSEDSYMSEEEKINLYKEIINRYKDDYNIILKKHPREKTVYGFESVLELSGSFPSEIFTMLQLKFEKAIGICTSAVSLIDANDKINTDDNFFNRRKINE